MTEPCTIMSPSPAEAFDRGATFKNFSWTPQAMDDWEQVWAALWKCGVQWSWQNGDRYGRRRGSEVNVFAVYNDAYRLDMAFPLPGIHSIREINEWLKDAHIDDGLATRAASLLRRWIKDYVE